MASVTYKKPKTLLRITNTLLTEQQGSITTFLMPTLLHLAENVLYGRSGKYKSRILSTDKIVSSSGKTFSLTENLTCADTVCPLLPANYVQNNTLDKLSTNFLKDGTTHWNQMEVEQSTRK